MSEYEYILEKISNAEFNQEPFKHLYIEEFLSEEHYNLLVLNDEVNLPSFVSTEKMLEKLTAIGYSAVAFPGCITDSRAYLNWYNSGLGSVPGHTHGLTEGFGMALRLQSPSDPNVVKLIQFLNSQDFLGCLLDKFELTEEVYVETAIQKYLSGYEISPHPDVRKKCLTYMLNINPDKEMEELDIHTHLMSFTKEREWIKSEWATNTAKDRCWVPWSWAETNFLHTKNNSVCMFAPSNDTLHAVKLDYDHCKYQRTNVYGNLWYTDMKHRRPPTTWREL